MFVFLDALHREGLEVVDARSPMLDARLIKNQDEIQTAQDGCVDGRCGL